MASRTRQACFPPLWDGVGRGAWLLPRRHGATFLGPDAYGRYRTGCWAWAWVPNQHHPIPAAASVASSAVMSTAIMSSLLLFKHQKVGMV